MAATGMQKLYTGRSGHLAVMAIFLHRGYNAAIPEVDRGDDIFVVQDSNGELSRIQVKASNGRGKTRRYAAYSVPMAQLKRSHTPELHYVFALYFEDRWHDFLVIPRSHLARLRNTRNLGIVSGKNLRLRLSFSDQDVLCGQTDLTQYRDNCWANWPIIKH